VVNKTHITIRLDKEKEKQHLQEGRKNTRQILVDGMFKMARVLKDFFKGTSMMGTRRARRLALMAKEDRSEWTATTSTESFQMALKATKNNQSQGFSWTSNNLRNVAASAANSIKVPFNEIRYARGWSTRSAVLKSKYINFAIDSSKSPIYSSAT
jgi:hypothetical protein